MLYHSKVSIVAALLLLTLTGCSGIGTASFREMSSAYRGVLEDYANDNVLLNIVRASQSMPISFLDVPSVVGSGSVTSTASFGATPTSVNPSTLGGFFSAASPTTYTPNASLQVGSSFNFTQSSLDNSSFMTAFLTDVSIESLSSLMNNDVGPDSILYSLVVESIELRDSASGKPIKKWENTPYAPDYPDFQKMLYRLIDSGLKTETVMQRVPLSAPMDSQTYTSNLRALVEAYKQPGVMVFPVPGPNNQMQYQLFRMMPDTRMCLTKHPSETMFESLFTDAAFCDLGGDGVDSRSTGKRSNTKTGVSQAGKQSLVIKLRSPRNIFYFMGAVASLQLGENPKTIRIKRSDLFVNDTKIIDAPYDDTNSILLFKIVKNSTPTGAIATVNYKGASYSLGDEGASKSVLTILSELITMSKVPGSVPPSPSVLIK